MGNFKIEIKGAGNHGVDREVKDGGSVDFDEGGKGTADAMASEIIQRMIQEGFMMESATITHWDGEVVDDLLTHERHGNF